MKKPIKILVLSTVLLLSFGCHTARAIEPLFPDDTAESDASFTESIDMPQDSIGRITDLNGQQWTKGADGHYRSDSDDCVFSEPLNKFICEKKK
ncbi:MAG TPA: hypothetical protein PK031_07950 [Pseudomonadales bacterium]|nr:hypothetical protein [Pseudomonadales bacterium]